MILKKALTTTSCFFVSAVLLSQMYSFAQARLKPQTIDTTAFSNFASNIQSISSSKIDTIKTAQSEEQITAEIIKVIDREVSNNIKKTRFAVVQKKQMIKAVGPKVQQLKTEALTVKAEEFALKTEDLSSYEINNTDLIHLYALSVDSADYSRFANTELASSYGEEVKDEVALKAASTENPSSAPIEADEVKMIQPAPKKAEVKNNNDDLVMFAYSDKVSPEHSATQDMDKKLYDRPISNAVKKAISREIGNAPIKKIERLNTQIIARPRTKLEEKITIDDQEIDLNSDETIVYDYSSEKTSKALTAAADQNDFTSAPTVTSHETQFVLRAKELNMNTHKSTQVLGFEFVPDYDRTERVSDNESGEINFGYSINGEMNTQTGVIQAKGFIPTRVELALGAMKGLEVPLLNDEGIQKFLQKQGLSIEGNLLMVALNSDIIDTEIDSSFGAKFFLDKNFKTVQQLQGASFVLFVGVKTGNVLIKYQLKNKESTQKIVYVGDGEMYFEDPSFKASERETYILTTRNLLGQKKKELSIDGGVISFFNTSTTAKKKALNAYELKVPALVTGMRKYLEFKHLRDSLFVGVSNEKEVEVPGNDFIAKVLEMNQISSLRERCVVQINLSKDLRSLVANGKNRSGEMFVESTFLDKDGNFTRDSYELAEKVFVTGDMEGQFSIKLDYIDGSSEFLKTFCSEGTYLVEQL